MRAKKYQTKQRNNARSPLQSPSKRKGLAGHTAPNLNYGNDVKVDSGVAGLDSGLAIRSRVHDTLEARLALVDVLTNTDKYYILQVLIDTHAKRQRGRGRGRRHGHGGSGSGSVSVGGTNYYVFRRWGRTGTAGQAKLEGPFSDEEEAQTIFRTIFQSKVGKDWSKAKLGTRRLNGKYEYLRTVASTSTSSSSSNSIATWSYYLERDPLGKPNGWYLYDPKNSEEGEQLYSEFVASNHANRLSTRFVHSESSGFTYKVDLSKMTQANTQSGTVRPIGRTDDGNTPP